jgi:spore cortex formation protein SpoVR/YcgB (stage V sporulation)
VGLQKGKRREKRTTAKLTKQKSYIVLMIKGVQNPQKKVKERRGGISKVELLALKCVNISRSEQRTKKRKNSSQKKKKAGQNNNNTKKNSECASTVRTRWNASNKQINKNNTQYEGNSKIVLRFRT